MAAAIPSKVSKWVDVAVSFAAAIVLWGALRKITHAPDADTWLWIGLVTEAVIFALYGVLYVIYPALPDNSHSEELTVAGEVVKPAKGGAIEMAHQRQVEYFAAGRADKRGRRRR